MSFEKELFEELNILRTNPKKYADKIRTYLKYFEGKVINIPGRKAGIATVEGPRAYEDAINYLDRQKVLEPFGPSKALFRISKDFLQKIQRKNIEDADDVDMEKLISKYGTFYGDFSRATDFGSQTPEQVLINLLVSDGDPTREQRTSLFNSSYKLVGICKGSHKTFPHCTVILKCTEFENSFDKDDNGFPEYLEEEGDSNSNAKNEPKTQPQAQPKATEEPKSKYQPKSRYQPQTKQETKINHKLNINLNLDINHKLNQKHNLNISHNLDINHKINQKHNLDINHKQNKKLHLDINQKQKKNLNLDINHKQED